MADPIRPPLSFAALKAVQEMEDYARRQLERMDTGWTFNRESAVRVLRTCVVEVFDAQINDYLKSPVFANSWIRSVAFETVNSTMGVNKSSHLDYSKTREHLRVTLKAHIETRRIAGSLGVVRIAGDDNVPRGSIQLKVLLDECRWTVEKFSQQVQVEPRSVYRHLSGTTKPRKELLARYEAAFSKKLGRIIRFDLSS